MILCRFILVLAFHDIQLPPSPGMSAGAFINTAWKRTIATDHLYLVQVLVFHWICNRSQPRRLARINYSTRD